MQRAQIRLPVVSSSGWELEEKGNADEHPKLHSAAESLVILQSLRQSRRKWLSSFFPKFSARTRTGKAPEVIPPEHTIKAHGRYDLIIGPHTFGDTAFYEVRYRPQLVSGQPHAAADLSAPPAPIPSSAAAAAAARLPFDAFVTPDLISQVNAASLTNPTLANLLQLAASGRATPDQLKTLGLLIHSLGAVSQAHTQDANPSSVVSYNNQPGPAYEERDFDLVIEFSERPSDKWVFPRGLVVCERDASSGAPYNCDVILSTCIPFKNIEPPFRLDPTAEENNANALPEVVTFRLSRVPRSLCDVLVAWAGGEQGLMDSRSRLIELGRQAAQRVFLQHQLPEGSVLTEVQAAVTQYATRLLAPTAAEYARQKRKAAARRTQSSSLYQQETGAEGSHPAKRRQVSRSKTTAQSSLIACRSCGQTDVPLMMGGRYCRPCIDAGTASETNSATQASALGPPVASSSKTISLPPPVAASAAAPVLTKPLPSRQRPQKLPALRPASFHPTVQGAIPARPASFHPTAQGAIQM